MHITTTHIKETDVGLLLVLHEVTLLPYGGSADSAIESLGRDSAFILTKLQGQSAPMAK